MDSSLINLIPNLAAARRSAKQPRSDKVDPPLQPPPAYTLSPHPSPKHKDTPEYITVPLRFDFLDTGVSHHDGTIAFGPKTTFQDFMALLEQKMAEVHDQGDPQMWHYRIVAEARDRTVWMFFTQDPDVRQDTWDRVLEGLREGRWKRFGVLCLREDVKLSHDRGKIVVRSMMYQGVRDW